MWLYIVEFIIILSTAEDFYVSLLSYCCFFVLLFIQFYSTSSRLIVTSEVFGGISELIANMITIITFYNSITVTNLT